MSCKRRCEVRAVVCWRQQILWFVEQYCYEACISSSIGSPNICKLLSPPILIVLQLELSTCGATMTYLDLLSILCLCRRRRQKSKYFPPFKKEKEEVRVACSGTIPLGNVRLVASIGGCISYSIALRRRIRRTRRSYLRDDPMLGAFAAVAAP